MCDICHGGKWRAKENKLIKETCYVNFTIFKNGMDKERYIWHPWQAPVN